MTQKLSGMEMMLNSLLKAAGFDPEEMKKSIGDTIGQFHSAISALQLRLNAIDENQRVISARLERIEIALGINKEMGHDAPIPRITHLEG